MVKCQGDFYVVQQIFRSCRRRLYSRFARITIDLIFQLIDRPIISYILYIMVYTCITDMNKKNSGLYAEFT